MDPYQIVCSRLRLFYKYPIVWQGPEGLLHLLEGRPLQLAQEALIDNDLDPNLAVSFDVHKMLVLQIEKDVSLHKNPDEKSELITQLIKGDPPLRIILSSAQHEWIMARTLDGTLGWIQAKENEISLASHSLPPALEGDFDPLPFVSSAKSFLGCRYLWGGTTREGVDCSGLIQRCAYQSNNRWLKRHTSHLLREGSRVSKEGIQAGDILVLTHKESPTYSHCAIVSEDQMAIHASRSKQKVIAEPLGEVLGKYKLLGARRL